MRARTERSLRRRLLWALIGVASLLVASFGVALGLFVNALEHELLERVVAMELDEMTGEHGRRGPGGGNGGRGRPATLDSA